jgi:hypothetical protein
LLTVGSRFIIGKEKKIKFTKKLRKIMGRGNQEQNLAAQQEFGDLLNKDRMHEPVSTLEVSIWL